MNEKLESGNKNNVPKVVAGVVLAVVVIGGAVLAYALNSNKTEKVANANSINNDVNSPSNATKQIDYSGFKDDITKDGKVSFKRPESLTYVNQGTDGAGFDPALCDYFSTGATSQRPCFSIKVLDSKYEYSSEYFDQTLELVKSDTIKLNGVDVSRYISRVPEPSNTSYVYEYAFTLNGKNAELYGEDDNSQLNDATTQTFEKIVASIVLK